LESKPDWQGNLSGSARQVPDLALDADPNTPGIFYYTASTGSGIGTSGWYGVGGTSLASPLFVGAWTVLQSATNNLLGFAPTLIYPFTTQFYASSALHDVTSGSNGGYSAKAGYDNVTGWGSFDIAKMLPLMQSIISPPLIYGGRINEGTTLLPGQGVYSAPNGKYELIMQYDGNLVLYNRTTNVAVWNTGTNANTVVGNYAVFQTDGNFVVYNTSGKALWASGTNTTYSQYLLVQDDGNMVIYESLVPVFDTATNTTNWGCAPSGCGSAIWNEGVSIKNGQSFTSPNGSNLLIMQADGNLVLYRQGVAKWSSVTAGNTGAYAIMQTDGNLVVYSSTNKPLWNSKTNGSMGAATYIQDDGNVVVYAIKPHWYTNTVGR
jgi:subtilase family serine protease